MSRCPNTLCRGEVSEYAPHEKLPRGRKRDDGASDKGFAVDSWVYICPACGGIIETSYRRKCGGAPR
jgi:hypothetical protein